MYKKIIATSAVVTSLLLSGCGSTDTTCRIDVQRDIDKGRFDDAISKLEGECASVYSVSDKNFNLAAAYMGKSGFGVSDVVNMIATSDDDSNSGAFTSFTRSVNENKNAGSLTLLRKAKEFFLKSIRPDANASVLSTLCDGNTTTQTPRVSNACLYVGFNQTLTTATTITYLTDDVDTLVQSIDGDANATTPDDMKASLDALSWAIDTNNSLPNGSIITPTSVNIKGASYAALDVKQNGKDFYRLAKSMVRDANNSTVITDGYCQADGNTTACEGIENPDGSIDMTKPFAASCYACPVTLDSTSSQGVADLLVDTLNLGTDAIVSISDDEDIQSSVTDFKKDITGGVDRDITINDILQYLNK